MFTDGITEARNAGEEDFGEDRLLACVTRHSADSPATLIGRVFHAVQEFCQGARQSDDITAAILRFR
jgi:sigma-B regulation protein RsbU (phosphoserine phosphatase)